MRRGRRERERERVVELKLEPEPHECLTDGAGRVASVGDGDRRLLRRPALEGGNGHARRWEKRGVVAGASAMVGVGRCRDGPRSTLVAGRLRMDRGLRVFDVAERSSLGGGAESAGDKLEKVARLTMSAEVRSLEGQPALRFGGSRSLVTTKRGGAAGVESSARVQSMYHAREMMEVNPAENKIQTSPMARRGVSSELVFSRLRRPVCDRVSEWKWNQATWIGAGVAAQKAVQRRSPH